MTDFTYDTCWKVCNVFIQMFAYMKNYKFSLQNFNLKGWVGDGECDDSCRTNECLYDNGDCDLGMNILLH